MIIASLVEPYPPGQVDRPGDPRTSSGPGIARRRTDRFEQIRKRRGNNDRDVVPLLGIMPGKRHRAASQVAVPPKLNQRRLQR